MSSDAGAFRFIRDAVKDRLDATLARLTQEEADGRRALEIVEKAMAGDAEEPAIVLQPPSRVRGVFTQKLLDVLGSGRQPNYTRGELVAISGLPKKVVANFIDRSVARKRIVRHVREGSIGGAYTLASEKPLSARVLPSGNGTRPAGWGGMMPAARLRWVLENTDRPLTVRELAERTERNITVISTQVRREMLRGGLVRKMMPSGLLGYRAK